MCVSERESIACLCLLVCDGCNEYYSLGQAKMTIRQVKDLIHVSIGTEENSALTVAILMIM